MNTLDRCVISNLFASTIPPQISKKQLLLLDLLFKIDNTGSACIEYKRVFDTLSSLPFTNPVHIALFLWVYHKPILSICNILRFYDILYDFYHLHQLLPNTINSSFMDDVVDTLSYQNDSIRRSINILLSFDIDLYLSSLESTLKSASMIQLETTTQHLMECISKYLNVSKHKDHDLKHYCSLLTYGINPSDTSMNHDKSKQQLIEFLHDVSGMIHLNASIIELLSYSDRLYKSSAFFYFTHEKLYTDVLKMCSDYICREARKYNLHLSLDSSNIIAMYLVEPPPDDS